MSESQSSYFIQLQHALQLEKQADQQEFLRFVREKPLKERVENGYAWSPLSVVKTGFALGEKAFVVVERTTQLNEPHRLRAGQSVKLFTQAPHVKHSEKEGIIQYVEKNRMKIILHSRDIPD
ncbi:MAG: hypothetical protein R2792_07955 [Saprospiraceae bacterium]